MKVIISQEQIDKMKSLIDKVGIDSLGIEPYRLIEMGVVEHYDGDLYLDNVPIKSLGELEYVGGALTIINCKQLSSFGKLRSVGGILFIRNCPLAELSDEEIRSQIEIKGSIYR
jgi:hypothetical protein